MTSKAVFVDTSGLLAVWHKQDQFHKCAVQQWSQLTQHPFRLLTSNYVLDETYSIIRKRLGIQGVVCFREMLLGDPALCQVFPVSAVDEHRAWEWFVRDMQRLSYTDATSFALMERLGVSVVFGFDQHFAYAGFRLME